MANVDRSRSPQTLLGLCVSDSDCGMHGSQNASRRPISTIPCSSACLEIQIRPESVRKISLRKLCLHFEDGHPFLD